MAIQSAIYPDTPVFTSQWIDTPAIGFDDDMHLYLQSQQLQPIHQLRQFNAPKPKNIKFLNKTETPSSSQSLEIDQFIHFQYERLRLVLVEQRKRDVAELLKKIETRTTFLLNQKDEEIAKANNRTSQLESLLVKLQTDCLTWQNVAKQNELHVNSLTNTIQLLQQQNQYDGVLLNSEEPLVEDTESCCDEQQSGLGKGKVVCRVCERSEVGVVVLPCRHLCLCGGCDQNQTIDLCPVCQTEKKGSVQALFC